MPTFAADSYDFIQRRVAELRYDERPRCPLNATRPLYDCLRATVRCLEACPLRHDWIGPQV